MSYCSILLPDAAELRLRRVISESDFLAVEVEVARAVVPCPGCGRVCSRRHSYYVRTLADLPSHGVRVQLRLRTRKFFCDARACSRRIFTERLPRTAAPYARCSLRLSEAFRNIGFVAGAEAGARLARQLGMATSPDTLLRRMRQFVIGNRWIQLVEEGKSCAQVCLQHGISMRHQVSLLLGCGRGRVAHTVNTRNRIAP